MTKWRVDKSIARRVIGFFEKCLVHCKGELAGQPFKLRPWERDYLIELFATVGPDGRRRYRRSLLAVPRKNGKSTLCAGIALYLLLADHEPGAEVYSCAADRAQAGIVHELAKEMVLRSPRLSGLAKPYQHRIVCPRTASFYAARSAEAYTAHGLNAHGVVFDELHAQKTADFWQVMLTSTGARRQPLIVAITTAGWDRNSICWAEWEYAARVRDGIVADETYLPRIFEAAPDDDWTNPKTWRKANPNLGVSVKLDYLKAKCAEAQASPRLENSFRQLHLNQWTEQAERWLPMDRWDACGQAELPELEGRECWAGLDLASVRDIAAMVLWFPLEDGTGATLARYWCPAEGVRKRAQQDRVPYDLWVHEGRIRATEGDVTDYDAIRLDIVALRERFNIREIAIDRWNSTQLQTQLAGDGFEVVPFGQGFASMSAPAKELERRVIEQTIRHGGDPVLRWMASNVAIKTDPAGNIKPDKSKSSEKIDGIVAMIMAIGRAMVSPIDQLDDQELVVV